MRIVKLSVPENGFYELGEHQFGIKKAVEMPRLGRLVVLAGANGAGKSRLLKSISGAGGYLSNMPTPAQADVERKRLNSEMINFSNAITNLAHQLSDERTRENAERSKLGFEMNIAQRNQRLEKLNVFQEHGTWITTDPEYQSFTPVFFVPTIAELFSAEKFTAADVIKNAELCRSLGGGDPRKTVPSYLKAVIRRARNAEYELSRGSSGAKFEDAIRDGQELRKIVRDLLGETAELSIDLDDQVTLFGRTDFADTLSNGQKILLMLATTLHAQSTDLASALLFLDEPENHLHPIVLNQMVDILLSRVTRGQVWIATHSVPLIARLAAIDPASIWYVNDSTVSHAGRKPEQVLHGLLGNADDISLLRDFTDLPAILAANRFAAECIFPPTTVPPREGDDQQLQMAKVLLSIAKPGRPLRVLDFGAGQGRLLAALHDATENAALAFDYVAYDRKGDDNQRCREQIASVYGSSDRFFTSLSDLGARFADGVDIVVMCNVLHEIPPSEWLSTIGPGSELTQLVRENGFILVVEDQRIPVGELAHEYGFLVFDTAQFNRLFKITESDLSSTSYVVSDAREESASHRGRLKAHLFKKEIVIRITDATRKNAIHDLYRHSASEMKRLRDPDTERSYANGQLYGFWMSQFANSALWMKDNGLIDGRD